MGKLDQYSLSDKHTLGCPFDYYDAMRRDDPVHFDEKAGVYILSRYEDVQKALAQPLVFSSGLGFQAQARAEYSAEIDAYYAREGLPELVNVVTSDPPYHTRIRSLMDKAFTAHRVASMEGYIREVADELIDSFIDEGQVEFVRQFAIPFPIFIIADQLGVPRADFLSFRRWSDATVEPLGRQLSKDRAIWCAEQTVEMWHYLAERFEERRATPSDDMISDLVHARIDDPDDPTLSPMELFQVVRALIVAGNETTTTAIGNGMLTLARNEALVEHLYTAQDDDRTFSRFCEEVLRLESPVQGLPRITTEDVELGGVRIPQGALVFLGYGSANRDETKFTCPEQFDVGRKNVGQQLAFGGGIHRCIGAMLARMEIKVASQQIVKRIKGIDLSVPESQLSYTPSMLVRALTALPLTIVRR